MRQDLRIVFVDGYNVINSWEELKKTKGYNLGAARDKLIEILQNYAAYEGHKIFIVFDAHELKGSLEKKEVKNNVVVVYTKEGETADSYIEKYVDTLGRKRDVLVVTSDSLEQQLAFQRGASRMSSLEFYHEVKKIEKRIEKQSEKLKERKKHLLEDRLEEDVLEKLEKLRRSK